MRKSGIFIAAAVVVIIGGVIVWFALGAKPQNSPTGATTNTGTNTEPSGTDSSAVIDQTEAAEVTVEMRNSSFTPQNLKIKKGTKVTWTNQDSIRHNVVAKDDDFPNGLPASNPLIGKGESYSFTFTTVGTVEYVCAPHAAFMTGKIEVVE